MPDFDDQDGLVLFFNLEDDPDSRRREDAVSPSAVLERFAKFDWVRG
jgi:hypothetical protein